MPCNSVSVAQVQITESASIAIQALANRDEPGLRAATEHLLFEALKGAGYTPSEYLGTYLIKTAAGLSMSLYFSGGRPTIEAPAYVARSAIDTLSSQVGQILAEIGNTLLAELLKFDMQSQGVEIIADTITPEGVRVLDFQYEVA